MATTRTRTEKDRERTTEPTQDRKDEAQPARTAGAETCPTPEGQKAQGQRAPGSAPGSDRGTHGGGCCGCG